MTRPTRLLLIVALFSFACQVESAGNASVTRRDSAGVTIVENPAPGTVDHPVWKVPPEPELVIGELDGPPETQFFRVTSVRRAADGTIVVANAGTHEVRLFGPEGRHLRSFGREGGGPGEFSFLSGAWPIRGDSILTFDGQQRRLQVFSRAGVVGRTRTFSGAVAGRLAGILDDGSLVTYRITTTAPSLQPHTQLRVFFRRSPSGERLDSLGVVDWIQVRPRDMGNDRYMMATPIFSPVGKMAVGRDRIYLSDAQAPSVQALDPEGRIVQVVRWAQEVAPVTDGDKTGYREYLLSSAESDEQRRRFETAFEQSEWAARYPALAELQTDHDGRLWVQAYSPPMEPGDPLWLIFGSDGRFQGTIRTPEGFELHEIGRDYLIGTLRDDLGIEQVRVYGRVRGADLS